VRIERAKMPHAFEQARDPRRLEALIQCQVHGAAGGQTSETWAGPPGVPREGQTHDTARMVDAFFASPPAS